MTAIKCSGCGEFIEIPDELTGDLGVDAGAIDCIEYYCDACEWQGQTAADTQEPDDSFCPYCGKDYEDFSDLGCEHCDRRVPGFVEV